MRRLTIQDMLIFIDIDGTLSIPRFMNKNNTIVSCMDEEDWINHCVIDNTPYGLSTPVKGMLEYIKFCKNNNCKVFTLSTCMSSFESKGKNLFLDTYYGENLFDDRIYVANDKFKVKIIKAVCEKYGKDYSEALLIEDSLSVMIMTNKEGIETVHVTEITSFIDLLKNIESNEEDDINDKKSTSFS